MLGKLEFAAVAVSDLDEGAALYERMFGMVRMTGVEERPQWGFQRLLMGNGRESLIELLSPTNSASPLARFIQERGEGVYMIAFEVDDVAGALDRARDEGARTLEATPVEGAEGRVLQGWIHPSATKGVFIGLRQRVEG